MNAGEKNKIVRTNSLVMLLQYFLIPVLPESGFFVLYCKHVAGFVYKDLYKTSPWQSPF